MQGKSNNVNQLTKKSQFNFMNNGPCYFWNCYPLKIDYIGENWSKMKHPVKCRLFMSKFRVYEFVTTTPNKP